MTMRISTSDLLQRDFYVLMKDTDQTICAHAKTYETGSQIHLNFNPISSANLPQECSEDQNNFPLCPFVRFIESDTKNFGNWCLYKYLNPEPNPQLITKIFTKLNTTVKKVIVHLTVPHTKANQQTNCPWEKLVIPIIGLCLQLFPNIQINHSQMIVYKELETRDYFLEYRLNDAEWILHKKVECFRKTRSDFFF